MKNWKETTKAAVLTKADDVKALAEMDERKRDKPVAAAMTLRSTSKTLAVIPAGFAITKCDPAPWSATCGSRDRFRVKGPQTKLPLPSKKQIAARKAK